MKPSMHFLVSVCSILTICATGRGQGPELVVQKGHTAGVYSVAFSTDRTTMATGGEDTTIKLWDVTTARELRTLSGHVSRVTSVAFSADGEILASGSEDRRIKLWEVATGRELHTLTGHAVHSLAFSADRKTLASGSSSDNTIKLWDVATGSEFRTLTGHSDSFNSVAFSADGKTLASGSSDKTIKLWDVATGRELRTLRGHSSWVSSVALSTDGKTLASGSGDKTIKVWEVATGRELCTLSGHSGSVYSVAFSVDGRTLASGSRDNTVRLWSVATGLELRELKGHVDDVFSVAFSADGKTLASSSGDDSGELGDTIKLWDMVTGRELRTFTPHSFWVSSVALSADGKTLASGSAAQTIKLWDLSSSREPRTLRGHSSKIISVAFSADAKTLASSSMDGTIKLWEVATGRELRTLGGDSRVNYSVAFSVDGQTLASGNGDGTIKLWEVATGRELRTLSGHFHIVHSVAFSGDGKTLASGSWDKTIKLWDMATGRELHTLSAHSDRVYSVALSLDGQRLATGSDSTIKLWDVTTGRELRTLSAHASRVLSVVFSGDGKTLASSGDNTVKLWQVSTGRELRTLSGHNSAVFSVAFGAHGRCLFSGSGDATIKAWEVSSGKELANLVSLDERDWTVVTPKGLFDGSPNAWKQLIWRFNNNTFDHAPVEAFFNEFYRPGLLSEIMSGKRPKAPRNIAQLDRRQPYIKLTRSDSETATNPGARNVTVQIEVEESRAPSSQYSRPIAGRRGFRGRGVRQKASQVGSGANDIRLFRNGTLVKLWQGDAFKLGAKDNCQQLPVERPDAPRSVRCEAVVPIVARENVFTAYAFNHDNIKSLDAEPLTITGSQKHEATTYVLAIGINNYASSGCNLNYAKTDADAFGKEVERQQLRLGVPANRIKIIPLFDEQAKRENIMRELTTLAKRVQPEDTLIIFFAGHGMAQDDRFYLVPFDLGINSGRCDELTDAGLKSIKAHSITDQDLEVALSPIDAGRILFVLDACNSGQILKAKETRRGPMNSKGLAQLAWEKGMYILTASQSYEEAQENKDLGRGFLTYVLTEEGGKSAEVDISPKDKQIDIREWLDYATRRVPQLHQELHNQMLKKRGLKLTGYVGSQHPRAFYRRETELQPWIISRQ